MPRAERKKKKIEFSFYDTENKILVESVWNEGKIRYLVYHIPSKEYAVKDSYVKPRYNEEIVPPPIDHDYIVKAQPIVIPEFNGYVNWEKYDVGDIDRALEEYIGEWLVLPPQYVTVLAAFVKFTWVHERSDVKPYLSIWGDKGTGKSSVVEVALQWICRYANYAAGGITPASLLRHVDAIHGTEIMDESDWLDAEESSTIRAILRGGYKSTGTYMLAEATGKGGFFPRVFNTGCPKILLGRQPISDDALRSRCLELPLQPIDVPNEKRRHSESWFANERIEKGKSLVDKLLIYRLAELPARYDKAPELLGYEARLSDTAQPLFYCLHNNKDRETYLQFVGKNVTEVLGERLESMEGKLLLLIRELLLLSPAQLGMTELLGNDVRITVDDLILRYKERFEPDTDEKDFKKHVNPWKVGKKLAGIGVKTKRGGGGRSRLLDPDSFSVLPELYKRYGLPPLEEALATPPSEQVARDAKIEIDFEAEIEEGEGRAQELLDAL